MLGPTGDEHLTSRILNSGAIPTAPATAGLSPWRQGTQEQWKFVKPEQIRVYFADSIVEPRNALGPV